MAGIERLIIKKENKQYPFVTFVLDGEKITNNNNSNEIRFDKINMTEDWFNLYIKGNLGEIPKTENLVITISGMTPIPYSFQEVMKIFDFWKQIIESRKLPPV